MILRTTTVIRQSILRASKLLQLPKSSFIRSETPTPASKITRASCQHKRSICTIPNSSFDPMSPSSSSIKFAANASRRLQEFSQKTKKNHPMNCIQSSYHSRSYVLTSGNNKNGSSDAQEIINSAAATTQWKRNQYRKIEEKFASDESSSRQATNGFVPNNNNNNNNNNSLPPLTIDNYDDVQPMWKEMESRVTRRRSLTLAERGGLSGRRNIRKSDEDVWMAAGVYDGPSGENGEDEGREEK